MIANYLLFKKHSLLLLVFVSATLISKSQTNDTLRLYNVPSGIYYIYYPFNMVPNDTNNPNNTVQYCRWDLQAPGYLKSLIIHWGGDTGTIKMQVLGQEGGVDFPQLFLPKVPSISLKKTKAGIQTYTYNFPNPVWLDDNQFWLVFDSVAVNSTIQIGGDNLVKTARCSSSTGGYYYDGALIQPPCAFKNYTLPGDTIADAYSRYIEVIMSDSITMSPNYFQDVTAAAGIIDTLSNWSVAWGDYDNDGYQDLLVTGNLYHNNGNGTFTDVTAASGMTTVSQLFEPTNMFVDMNNDGFLDVVVVTGTNSYLFLNNGKGGGFTTQPLNLDTNFIMISSMNFADLNNDKYPDMFVGQLWNGYPNPLPNHFFYNNKKNGFRNADYTFPTSKYHHSRGSSFCDYDNDGNLDLYVANYYLIQDELWHNNGDSTFTRVDSAEKHIDNNIYGYHGHGTGIDWYDYDNDGDMDIFLSMLAHPNYMQSFDERPTTIYNNTGSPNYNFIDTYSPGPVFSNSIGVEYEDTHAGVAWGDINADGLVDFAICTFYGCRNTDLYLQKPDHTFALKTFEYGIQSTDSDDDLCFADFDNDGKLDLAFANNNVFKLFKNTGPTGNFLELDVKSVTHNDYAIGAHVFVYSGGQQYMQEVKAGKGERQQPPYRLFYGLGTNKSVDSVVVRWPNTATSANGERFTGFVPNKFYTVTEGGIVVEGVPAIHSQTVKLSVFPNPFTSQTTFMYTIKNSAQVKLEIYSAQGRLLHVIQNGFQQSGEYVVSWDGTTATGNSCPNGMYLYRLSGTDFAQSGKLILER